MKISIGSSVDLWFSITVCFETLFMISSDHKAVSEQLDVSKMDRWMDISEIPTPVVGGGSMEGSM